MRAWIRTAIRRDCGRCGIVVQPGEPVLRLTFPMDSTKALYRCEGCAGPAPTDEALTADVAPPADRSAMFERIRKLLGANDHDWKLSQSGDDR